MNIYYKLPLNESQSDTKPSKHFENFSALANITNMPFAPFPQMFYEHYYSHINCIAIYQGEAINKFTI